MPVTKQEVIQRLGAHEPNYKKLAQMGPDAVPHLAALIHGDDLGLAAKAVYLASVIQTSDAIDLMAAAAASSHDIVRLAASSGLLNLSGEPAARLAERLLDDPDAGVRKVARRAASRLGLSALAVR